MRLTPLFDALNDMIRRSNFYVQEQVSIRTTKDSYLETIAFWDIPVIQSRGKRLRQHTLSRKYLPDFGLGQLIASEDPEWVPFDLDVITWSAMLSGALGVYEKCYLASADEPFGCCSRFEECSNALKCVCIDKARARGCMYLRNLLLGRVFYGRNRNV